MYMNMIYKIELLKMINVYILYNILVCLEVLFI